MHAALGVQDKIKVSYRIVLYVIILYLSETPLLYVPVRFGCNTSGISCELVVRTPVVWSDALS